MFEWKCGMKRALQYATRGLDVSSLFLLVLPESFFKMARISNCFLSIINVVPSFYMYVYLTSDGKNTFVGCASEPAACYVEKGWNIYMALEVSDHMSQVVSQRWKREARGLVSRINKGFKLAKQYFLTVHVTNLPIGELKILNQYAPVVPGTPKVVPDSFWEKL